MMKWVLILALFVAAVNGGGETPVNGEWHGSTLTLATDGSEGQFGTMISFMPMEKVEGEQGSVRGLYYKLGGAGEISKVRTLKVRFTSATKGDILIGEAVDYNPETDQPETEIFAKFAAFDFKQDSGSTWTSQGAWDDGSDSGMYVMRLMGKKTTVLSMVSNSSGKMFNTVYQQGKAVDQPMWKKYGLSGIMLVAFILSKVYRGYRMTQKMNTPEGTAGSGTSTLGTAGAIKKD